MIRENTQLIAAGKSLHRENEVVGAEVGRDGGEVLLSNKSRVSVNVMEAF